MLLIAEASGLMVSWLSIRFPRFITKAIIAWKKIMFLNTKTYFHAGLLVILLGLQLQVIDSFVLSEGATRALARVAKTEQVASRANMTSLLMTVHPEPKKKVTPPDWLGLTLVTAGVMMCGHSIAIRRR